MRVKKQKQVRRAVRFYKACFGFREPFRVLCDGNFLHYVLKERLGALKDILPALLGDTCKPLVTRCVIAELKRLGEDFSGTALAARRLDIARCNHDSPKAAGECLEDMVGTNNPEHFFVATQDVELRKKFRKVHGGALMYAKLKHLVIEPPSEHQQLIARKNESSSSHMTPKEAKIVEARQEKKRDALVGATEESEFQEKTEFSNGSNQAADTPSKQKGRQLGIHDKPQFKRKRAKGPNPLSCRKKLKDSKRAVGNGTVVAFEGGNPKQRSRKRTRQRTKHIDKA